MISGGVTMLNAFEEIEKEIQDEVRLSIARKLIGMLADEVIIEKTGVTPDQLKELKLEELKKSK